VPTVARDEHIVPHLTILSADVLCTTWEKETGETYQLAEDRLGNIAELRVVHSLVEKMCAKEEPVKEDSGNEDSRKEDSGEAIVLRYSIATKEALSQALNTDGCHMLHICCHGDDYDYVKKYERDQIFWVRKKPGKVRKKTLLLERADGTTEHKTWKELEESLNASAATARQYPKLVFLACCHGEAFGQLLVGKREVVPTQKCKEKHCPFWPNEEGEGFCALHKQ
jgi:hypothetical protein